MGSTVDFNPNISVDMDSTSTGKKKKTSNNFGLDDFYKLLAVQLQNQDMMNPVDDSQFVAQMAQMATIQAMDQMNQMTMTSYAFSFMGKDVIIADYDDHGKAVTYTGPVEKVVLYNGKPQVYVNGEAFELSQVMEVLTPNADTSMDLLDLIDRNVAIRVVDEENSSNKETKYKLIYGVVDKVTRYDGKMMVTVDGESYEPGQIVEILPDDWTADKEEETTPKSEAVNNNIEVNGDFTEEKIPKENQTSKYQGEQGAAAATATEVPKTMIEGEKQETSKVEGSTDTENHAINNG